MVTQTIPADKIIKMNPGVVAVGGSEFDLTGVILTANIRVPIGQVYTFSSAAAVLAFFGPGTEYNLALIYFQGPDGASVTPGQLLFTQYPTSAVAGYVRGGPITLAAVQAITTGTLTVTPDGGAAKTTSALNLSTATSLSNAASIIQAAFTSPGFTVTYDSQSGGFVITSSTTGVTSSIAVTTGTVATALQLTAATGAVTSPGAAIATPAAFMDALVGESGAWTVFMTAFEPGTSDCVSFAAWNNGKNSRYWYVCWDTDTNNLTQNPSTTVQAEITAAGYNGTTVIYSPVNGASAAAFALSYAASLNWNAIGGRKTMAFRSQSGLPADITSGIQFDELIANGLTFYGSYSAANNNRVFFYAGNVSGKFLWADSYLDAIHLCETLQVSLLDYMAAAGTIPFNRAGDAQIAAAVQQVIDDHVTFGAIVAGVDLTDQQVQEVNAQAGVKISDILNTRGYYLAPNASNAAGSVRTARGPINPVLWYTDGQSVQSMTFNTLEVQ